MEIKKILEEKILFFDGAMGTMLQRAGLKRGEIPEVLNIEDKDKIINIHKKYIEAGANIITTNTFGANELKLEDIKYSVEEIIEAAIKNAKKASENRDTLVALDIGPIGELLEPMGTLKFEKAYNVFKRQVIQGVKSGADVILIETMADLYEVKAAVLAAKENSDLPVFCTMTFEKDKRTFTGCSILSMIMTLEGLGVDALGVNCSLGPVELEPIVSEILEFSSIPVMVQPNAGLPKMVNGETIYEISKEEFSSIEKRMAEKGARILGGCCGTDDIFIKKVVEEVSKVKPIFKNDSKICGVCTPTNPVIIDGVKVIGERINPTGKKLFKEALKNNDIDYIVKQALSQIDAGADILDVNVGLPEINEAEMMIKVVKELQSVIDIPLQIDSNDKNVIEKALRIYNGKAIVNSVNGEEKVLNSILPIVKKYGASVIGLTLDEKGIPLKAEDRFKVAEKIVNKCLEYGIPKEDIIIDCLTLTVSAQQKEVVETLKALNMVKNRLKVKTVLGVSNVSFGLPNRELLNSTFLAMALRDGLDLPIVNPNKSEIMDTIYSFKVLNNEDVGGEDYIKLYSNFKPKKDSTIRSVKTIDNKDSNKVSNEETSEDLIKIIIKGIKDKSAIITKELLKNNSELKIVNEYLIPALDIVGKKYEKGDIFLPQLIQSAETVKKAFEVIKEKLILENKDQISRGKIILATVKGDIHDIGKNIVKTVLENYGFTIIDLGKDVPKEEVVKAAKDNNVKLIGLSALMTTTVKSMEETIEALNENNIDCKVFVGGAVLNEDYAEMIKADYYAKDAKEAVEIAEKILC